MSNRVVEQQNFDAQDPFAGLALVTKPVPKAEPGHVVVRITLRPVNPGDLMSIRSNSLPIPGSEGFGIVHEVKQASFFSSVSCNFVGKYHCSFFSLCVCVRMYHRCSGIVAGRGGSDNSGERAKSGANCLSRASEREAVMAAICFSETGACMASARLNFR
jgi:hypothetical protein